MVSEQDAIRLGKRKVKMDAVLTLVVANKPKNKYKCKQEKEKEGNEVEIMQLPKLEAKLVGEDLNSMRKA